MRILGLLLLISAVQLNGENTYVVTIPKVVRPGLDYRATVNILETMQDAVAVTIQLHKNSTKAVGASNVIAEKSQNFEPGKSEDVMLTLPPTLGSGSYFVRVVGWNQKFSFEEDGIVTFSSKHLSVFVQTDKAIYKAGQTVHMRVVVVTSDLKPHRGTVDVDISDPAGNRIRQWRALQLMRGVTTLDMELADQPVFGDWVISADADGEAVKKSFTVDEYVLPKFEVTVDVPTYYYGTKIMATGKVGAKYTYGKSVAGTAVVALTVPSGYQQQEKKYEQTVELGANGKADFSFELELGEQRLWQPLSFEATVTEALTGISLKGAASVPVYQHDVKLEWEGSQYFKPGLKYSAYLKVTRMDGSPLAASNDGYVKVAYGVDGAGVGDDSSFTSREVPSNGVVAVDVYPPRDSHSSLQLMARHSEAENSGFFTAQAFTAQSETFLQLTLDKEKVEVGSPLPLVVTVNSTVPIDQLTYQVVCKGNVVLASALIMGGLTTSTLTLAVTTQMAPESRLFAYYVHEGELIADGVMFSVDGAFQNQVEVEFSQTQALPGKQVEVQVYTNPDSFIGLLAVDQSVQLLKSGNDITQEEVVEELSTYGGGGGAGGRPVLLLRGGRVVRRKRSFLPWYFNSGSASSVIRDAGLLVLTDALIYKDSPDYYDCPNCEMEMFAVARADGGAPRRNVKMKSAVADDGGATTVETEEGAHVRKLFPETWLWVNASTPSDSGTTTVMATVPDTITSWLASAISMNEKHGLGITEHTTTLTAFQPFFVSLTLPYSVLRGEVLVLQATVFNYMNADTQVEVTLDHSDDFENVPEEAESDADAAQVKRGQVPADGGVTFNFPIRATKLGNIQLSVRAQASNAGDAVQRSLLVKAEGVTRHMAETIFIEDGNEGKVSMVEVMWPAEFVEGSQRLDVSVTGDVMGSTVSNMGSLLRMPFGCGEQNMLNFAPNIFVTDYLQETDQLTKAVKDKAVRFMEVGYQRELTYQRDDGSFSAFGKNDDSGSMWLTAFVAKSFHQARDHIYVDQATIKKALRWILLQQGEDGSFPEPGRVIHTDMQGGAAGGIPLTAYTLVSLLENRRKLSSDSMKVKLDDAIRRGEKRLVSQLDVMADDPYSLAVTTYALVINNAPIHLQALSKLEALATEKGGMKYWTKQPPVSDPASSASRHGGGASVDVEMTAYALLTYVRLRDLNGGLPVMKWLIKQQNSFGGFSSTQDTVIGLQALAQFASLAFSSTPRDLILSAIADDITRSFEVDSDNALVYQMAELPITDAVEVVPSGTGSALVQVKWSYNVKDEGPAAAFDLTSNVIHYSTGNVHVQVCSQYKKPGKSGMSVVTMNLPSGFVAERPLGQSHLVANVNADELQRLETSDGETVVNVYYNEIGQEQTCVTIVGQRAFDVKDAKPSPVRVMDYYHTEDERVAYYSVDSPMTIPVIASSATAPHRGHPSIAAIVNIIAVTAAAAMSAFLLCA